MSRKQKKYVITSEQMFDFQKPKFNGFACGYGIHKDKSKYNRKQKHRKDLMTLALHMIQSGKVI